MKEELNINESDYKFVVKKLLEDMLLAEFDSRSLDDPNWGVYRINEEGEIYPTPFVQCQTLGHALYRYATVYAKKSEAYAVAPLMTNEELTKNLQKDYPEQPEQSHPKSDH